MTMILTVITIRYGSVDISVLLHPNAHNRAVYGIGVQASDGYAKFFMAEQIVIKGNAITSLGDV